MSCDEKIFAFFHLEKAVYCYPTLRVLLFAFDMYARFSSCITHNLIDNRNQL